MKLLFIDETSDSGNPNYLGVCAALIDATRYSDMKRSMLTLLSQAQWDVDTEFKGTTIYSQSKGCEDILVDQRIRLAEQIINLNASNANARITFSYRYSPNLNTSSVYLRLVHEAVNSLVKQCSSERNGKNLISIHCDERRDVDVDEIRTSIAPILERKGYVLFEDIMQTISNNQSVGLMFADIVGYLISRVHNIHVSESLLSDPDSETAKKNGQLRKLVASKKILSQIKQIRVMPIVGTLEINENGTVSVETSLDRNRGHRKKSIGHS